MSSTCDPIDNSGLGFRHRVVDVNVDISGDEAPIWGQLEADCRPIRPEIGSDCSNDSDNIDDRTRRDDA